MVQNKLDTFYKSHKKKRRGENIMNEDICDLTYQEAPIVRTLDFELQGCKVKIQGVSENLVLAMVCLFLAIFNTKYEISKSK